MNNASNNYLVNKSLSNHTENSKKTLKKNELKSTQIDHSFFSKLSKSNKDSLKIEEKKSDESFSIDKNPKPNNIFFVNKFSLSIFLKY